jgi:hypothetical protein
VKRAAHLLVEPVERFRPGHYPTDIQEPQLLECTEVSASEFLSESVRNKPSVFRLDLAINDATQNEQMRVVLQIIQHTVDLSIAREPHDITRRSEKLLPSLDERLNRGCVWHRRSCDG